MSPPGIKVTPVERAERAAAAAVCFLASLDLLLRLQYTAQ